MAPEGLARPGLDRHSVFFRLVVTLFIAAVTVNVLVWNFQREIFGRSGRDPLMRMAAHYLDELVLTLGAPPDPVATRAVCDKLGFEIRFEGGGHAYASSPGLPEMAELREEWPKRMKTFGLADGRIFLLIERPKGTYAFISLPHPPWILEPRVVLTLLGSLSLVLFACYVSLRRMLNPLRALAGGMDQVSRGQLDVKVAVPGRNELARLADSFNEMTARIRAMMGSQRQLLLDVSHELRSPLTRMKLDLEFVEDGPHKESLSSDIRELEAMIQELLETETLQSNAGGLKLEATDLGELLRSVAAGRIELELPAEPVSARLDGPRLRTLCKNLFDNALKYSPPASARPRARLTLSDASIQIQVLDHGMGISPEALPHIFEPFYRADPSRSRDSGGYGLGLSLVSKIAAAHGGSVTVESQPGQGSCFTVTLPRHG